MKVLMSAAVAAMSVAAVPVLAHAQSSSPEIYGNLGYNSSRAEGADTGAIQGRLGAKLTPHFGVEGELSGGVKDDNIDRAGVRDLSQSARVHDPLRQFAGLERDVEAGLSGDVMRDLDAEMHRPH